MNADISETRQSWVVKGFYPKEEEKRFIIPSFLKCLLLEGIQGADLLLSRLWLEPRVNSPGNLFSFLRQALQRGLGSC